MGDEDFEPNVLSTPSRLKSPWSKTRRCCGARNRLYVDKRLTKIQNYGCIVRSRSWYIRRKSYEWRGSLLGDDWRAETIYKFLGWRIKLEMVSNVKLVKVKEISLVPIRCGLFIDSVVRSLKTHRRTSTTTSGAFRSRTPVTFCDRLWPSHLL